MKITDSTCFLESGLTKQDLRLVAMSSFRHPVTDIVLRCKDHLLRDQSVQSKNQTTLYNQQ